MTHDSDSTDPYKKTRQNILAKVDKEIEAGRMWRAKERLRDNVGNAYDTALYERYGQILEQTEDKVEAGKYYFLSGVQQPQYVEAIQLFLDRYGKTDASNLIGQFPGPAKFVDLARCPEVVAKELLRLGFADPFEQKVENENLSLRVGEMAWTSTAPSSFWEPCIASSRQESELL